MKKCTEYQTVESGDGVKKSTWNIYGTKILTSFFYWTLKFWECSDFAAACLGLLKLGEFPKSPEKAVKWSARNFHVTSTFHSHHASHETYSALTCSQWQKSCFSPTCCVIIVWQPEAYRWILRRKQLLDAGHIYRRTQTCNPKNKHAPYWVDTVCTKDLHTLSDN